MTNFEKLRTMSEEEFIEWLDKYGIFDASPWNDWFNANYCEKCEPITVTYAEAKQSLGIDLFSYESEVDCGYCELASCCKFCPEISGIPSNSDIIRLWLKQEATNANL